MLRVWRGRELQTSSEDQALLAQTISTRKAHVLPLLLRSLSVDALHRIVAYTDKKDQVRAAAKHHDDHEHDADNACLDGSSGCGSSKCLGGMMIRGVIVSAAGLPDQQVLVQALQERCPGTKTRRVSLKVRGPCRLPSYVPVLRCRLRDEPSSPVPARKPSSQCGR
jgi:hypothetical protein